MRQFCCYLERKTLNLYTIFIPFSPKLMNRIIALITSILLLFFCNLPISAQSVQKPTKKELKKQKVEIVGEIDPDPVAKKARPDRHPKALPMPKIFGGIIDDANQLHGIDVSHYQGRIDWNETALDHKVGYVYLKATEGTSIVDNTYAHNFQECKRVGLKVGSYLFFRPQYSAKAQFDLFKSVVDTKSQDLLPLVDAESMKGASIATFQARLIELCELLEQEYGKKPIIYTGQNFYNSNIHGNQKLKAYKYFIAKYDVEPPYLTDNEDYIMWQFTARGSVKGIRGHVDQSRFVGRHGIREILYK